MKRYSRRKIITFFSNDKIMADHQVDFTINIGGNAYKGVATLDAAMGKLNVTLKWQDIVLNILIAKETVLNAITKIATAVQWA